MQALIQRLNQANEAYYQGNEEILSNLEYDQLYDELCNLEESIGISLSNSPTQQVGYVVLSELEKIAHEKPMLSLDKTKEIEKLKSFLGKQKGILSWKLDGLTIVLKYDKGKLKQAVTRGNGQIGEDVTHNAKVFSNIPLEIPYQEELTIRGEGIISQSNFEKINETLSAQNEVLYKNPRNLCSSTVRQFNNEITKKRGVEFFAFSVVSQKQVQKDSKHELLQWVKELGFSVVEYELLTADILEERVGIFQQKIQTLDLGSDGLVLTFDNIAYSEKLGSTSKFPRDSIAFKWADEMAQTTLKEVLWNTSRTGLMNPIAIFEPVDLEGTEVSRASLHNISMVKKLKLGLGDEVMVYKANMVIPQIAENLTQSDTIEIPSNCFVCGGETEVVKVKDGEVLYCKNEECEAKKIQQFSHFVSRNAMNIDGLSEETLKKFLQQNFLKTFVDIYQLQKHQEEIEDMKGFGKRSYERLMRSIEKSRTIKLPHVIYALGIDQVGLSNAKVLCEAFGNDIERIQKATKEQIQEIDGFGEIIAQSVFGYFANEKQKENTMALLEELELIPVEHISDVDFVDNPMKGLTFVITGSLELFESRKVLMEVIENYGGKVVGSVTKKTNYLINNDKDSASSKNKKAQANDIPIIDEATFIELFKIEE